MSVTTRSDELFSEAKEKINEAANLLLKACNDETWGSADYRQEYIDYALKCAVKLIKIRSKL